MKQCPVCNESTMRCSAYHCDACDITIEGTFESPALQSLSMKDAMLAEQFILHGGNLKSLAVELDITYPTLRKRLDAVIASLTDIKKQKEERMSEILDGMEKGTVSAQAGVRHIKELNYES